MEVYFNGTLYTLWGTEEHLTIRTLSRERERINKKKKENDYTLGGESVKSSSQSLQYLINHTEAKM